MRVTTKGRYGLRAVVKLAVSSDDGPISIRQLSEAEDISAEFLEQIFFRLRKAGIINSTRGPGGGFRLNRRASEISVKDVFDAVGEEINLSPCTSEDQTEPECVHREKCPAHFMWCDAADHIREYFSGITLQDIIKLNEDKGAPVEPVANS